VALVKQLRGALEFFVLDEAGGLDRRAGFDSSGPASGSAARAFWI